MSLSEREEEEDKERGKEERRPFLFLPPLIRCSVVVIPLTRGAERRKKERKWEEEKEEGEKGSNRPPFILSLLSLSLSRPFPSSLSVPVPVRTHGSSSAHRLLKYPMKPCTGSAHGSRGKWKYRKSTQALGLWPVLRRVSGLSMHGRSDVFSHI